MINKKMTRWVFFFIYGGDGGVRTPDTVARIRDFESRAFNQLCHISVVKEIIYI